MRASFVVLFIVLIPFLMKGQDTCLSQGLRITNQADIDNFYDQFPNCNVVLGTVDFSIDRMGLDFSGLRNIKEIHGNLESWSGYKTFGLENLEYVRGDIVLFSGSSEQITGLDTLSKVGGNLMIRAMVDLRDVKGLSSLDSTFGTLLILENLSLSTVEGLEHLEYSNGLVLMDNPVLEDIDAFQSDYYIDSVLQISGTLLSDCAIRPVCDFIIETRGLFTIRMNPQGCEHEQVVRSACLTSNSDIKLGDQPVVFNNALNALIFDQELIGQSVNLELFNVSGHVVDQHMITVPPSHQLLLEHINPGMYILRLQLSSGRSFSLKLVL